MIRKCLERNKIMYDLIIIGMGPAGVSAAIYAKRAGLKLLCFDKAMVGGYLNYIDRVDNYAGLYGFSGPDIAFNFLEAINNLDIEVINKEVLSVLDGDVKKVVTKDGEYLAKNIIIATGRVPKKIGIENEDNLRGHGISNCALCDGAFYRNKEVAVLGAGESALQEALYLANICKKVYIIHRRDKLSVIGYNASRVKETGNIEILYEKVIAKLKDKDGILDEIVFTDDSKLKVSALFVYIGFKPITNFLSNLDILTNDGYVLVNQSFETKIKGIYAIGDTIKKDLYQISVAVGEGAVVANKIINSILE